MSIPEDEIGCGRVPGGKGADHQCRVSESADHTSVANMLSEAAQRQGTELLPKRRPITLQPNMSEAARSLEDSFKGGTESTTLRKIVPSTNQADLCGLQDDFVGFITAPSPISHNAMADSLGSLIMDTAPASPGFDLISHFSFGNTESNMTSMATSPNPSRKNTMDEQLDNVTIEGHEVKRAKTEHYGSSSASTQMATDIIMRPPPHSQTFPLPNTYLTDRPWPELVHMQAGMNADFNWKTISPPRSTPGYLWLTPDKQHPHSQAGLSPRKDLVDLPIRLAKFPHGALDADKCSPHDNPSPGGRIFTGRDSLSYRAPTLPPPQAGSNHKRRCSPEFGDSEKPGASRLLVVCDSYGEVYYDMLCQAVHTLILEHTPTALLDDLEKPLKMVAVLCAEKAINMIQDRLCQLSYTERVTDCGGGTHDGHRSHGPSYTTSASTWQQSVPRQRQGKSNKPRGDDDPGDDTNNNENQDGIDANPSCYPDLLKRGRTGYSCPFRKRNPVRFNIRDAPGCALQPYANFTLLKRHIKAHHACDQPKFLCRRCKEDMGSSEHLEEHLNAPLDSICESRAEAPHSNPENGISREIEEALSARGNGRKVDSWVVLWRTLFPDAETTPSEEFEPPVGLEEVAAKFGSQQKELLGKLQQCFETRQYQGVDPDGYVNLANGVCQEYIDETLDACEKIPYTDGTDLNGQMAASIARRVFKNPRIREKERRPLIGNLSRPLQPAPAAMRPANHTHPHHQIQIQTQAASQSHLFSSSHLSDAPYPALQNPPAGYLQGGSGSAIQTPPSSTPTSVESQLQIQHSSSTPGSETGAVQVVMAHPAAHVENLAAESRPTEPDYRSSWDYVASFDQVDSALSGMSPLPENELPATELFQFS